MTAQLKLDLYGRLEIAESDPIDANLSSLWDALDEEIANLPPNDRLITAGDTIARIAAIFLMRSITSIEDLESKCQLEPKLPFDCFAHLIRQSMAVDFSPLVKNPRSHRLPNQDSAIKNPLMALQDWLDNLDRQIG